MNCVICDGFPGECDPGIHAVKFPPLHRPEPSFKDERGRNRCECGKIVHRVVGRKGAWKHYEPA